MRPFNTGNSSRTYISKYEQVQICSPLPSHIQCAKVFHGRTVVLVRLLRLPVHVQFIGPPSASSGAKPSIRHSPMQQP